MSRSFLERPAHEVAPELLGAVLTVKSPDGSVALRLTEVEAYAGVGEDPGSHAFRGRTNRNAVMFGPAGHLYVYFTYGMHWCANIVCGLEGDATAVLLRAGEVIEGRDLAVVRRTSAKTNRELARGPARLCSALSITGEDNGLNILSASVSRVTLRTGRPVAPSEVQTGPRTGVGGAGAQTPWRFWIDSDPTVSPYRASKPPRAAGSRL